MQDAAAWHHQPANVGDMGAPATAPRQRVLVVPVSFRVRDGGNGKERVGANEQRHACGQRHPKLGLGCGRNSAGEGSAESAGQTGAWELVP